MSDPSDDPCDDVVRVPIEASIDLHAFAPRDVVSVVEAYLDEARARGLTEVRLIHGRGIGAQRAAIHRMLRTLDRLEFHDAPDSHLGATVVRFLPLDPPR